MDARDSRWDPGVRRSLRQELRDELMETNRRRDEITIPDELDKKVDKGNTLLKKIVSSREAVIDSEHFRVLSEIANQQSQAARGELFVFEPIKFREKLITFMGGRGAEGSSVAHIEWHTLGERAIKAFSLAPCINFSYGALETVPVRQIVRRAAGRASKKTTSIEKPKQIQNLEQEEESTTKDVQHMLHHLKTVCRENGGMSYHKFLVDPGSFSRTVENIFHFSFLIKEGRAGIRRDGENGEPFVFIPENVDNAGQSTKTSNCQAIVSVNKQKWMEWIDYYEITEPYIPLRET